jgi:hypothetical protein
VLSRYACFDSSDFFRFFQIFSDVYAFMIFTDGAQIICMVFILLFSFCFVVYLALGLLTYFRLRIDIACTFREFE